MVRPAESDAGPMDRKVMHTASTVAAAGTEVVGYIKLRGATVNSLRALPLNGNRQYQ